MSIRKTMLVGRRKLPIGQKKITWSFTVDQELLRLMRLKAKHGKIAAWARGVLWAAVKK